MLTPNIDERGVAHRRRLGYVSLGAAAVLAVSWPLRTGSALGWSVCVALAAVGALGLFQARNRWCIARACGIQTKI